MTYGKSLLRAILDDPGSDVARLAYADLVNANRDTILRITEKGLRRVVRCLKAGDIPTALKVIEAVNTFHPMHGESWIGWPKGSS